MTYTTYSDNFATFIDPAANDLKDLLDQVAGDFADDYDMDQAVSDYVDELNKAVNPLGVDVTVSGVAYCDYDADPDADAVREAALTVDVDDILQRNDKTKES